MARPGWEATRSRKLDHLRVVMERDVEAAESTLLNYVRPVHNPLPELGLEDVDLSVTIFGKRLDAPIMITGMTGGHPDVKEVNAALARVAERHRIAVGVGSQRAAIENPELADTYSVVREYAPSTVVVANIGAPQLAKGYGVREALKAVEMIEADALAIHLNPAQELFQVEGDRSFRGVYAKIAEIASEAGVPVIVKETGTGIPGEAAAQLHALGVACIDVSGLGGTNWVKVEVIRSGRGGAGGFEDYWGVPTAVATAEARAAAPEACIIASGGVRTGLDAARALALGADMVGVALPALRILLKSGEEALDRYISSLKAQLRAALLLTGSRSIAEYWLKPVVIHGRLAEELGARGVTERRLWEAKYRRLLAVKRRGALA
ncbi:type 2 isopentenyl-diphosphate Delta-isomerase [Stetteria hydrogenophila]